MHCGGCDNIPFWRWLKVNQKIPTSITCNDFDGEKLSNLQPNEFTDCFSEYLCILSFKRHQMHCWIPVMCHKAKTDSVAPHISGSRIGEPSRWKGYQYEQLDRGSLWLMWLESATIPAG